MNFKDYLVLYVDDEKANRIVFEQGFSDKFRLRMAASAEAALEIMKEEIPAVLITDQRMPGMSGDELLAKVKQLYPEVVRVVLTAYSDVDPILRAVNEGLVARYIIKPWNRAEMNEIMRWGVEAHALGRESSSLQLRLLQTERLITLGSMAGAMLHDLNQPLANLTLNVRYLSQLAENIEVLRAWAIGKETQPPDEARQLFLALAIDLPPLIQDLDMSCKVMRDLSNFMRQFVRAEPSETGNCEPIPVCRHALAVCQEILVRVRARLEADIPDSFPAVKISSTELTQVLVNVLSNAGQAIERKVTVGGEVGFSLKQFDGKAQFTISDNGAGMSQDVLAKVGKPFFSTRSEGTGLGVAQCQRLIGRTGGTFEIHSQEGKGTEVTFTVPIL